MLRAEKGNVVIDIEDKEIGTYQALGYDIIKTGADGKTEILAYGQGKTVPYGQFIAIKDELDKVKAELAAFKKLLEVEAPVSKAKTKKK